MSIYDIKILLKITV